MNTIAHTFSLGIPSTAPRRAGTDSAYAPQAQTAALLRSGAQYRRERMEAADMVTTDEAAQLAGTTRVTINAWIKNNRCLGVSHLRRGFKLPKWQFEPFVFPLIQPLAKALDSSDGWQLLAFLESPQVALDGQTPRTALEQGTPSQRILALASAQGH